MQSGVESTLKSRKTLPATRSLAARVTVRCKLRWIKPCAGVITSGGDVGCTLVPTIVKQPAAASVDPMIHIPSYDQDSLAAVMQLVETNPSLLDKKT